jgi:hypothetical protein
MKLVQGGKRLAPRLFRSTPLTTLDETRVVEEVRESNFLFFPWRARPISTTHLGTFLASSVIQQCQGKDDFLRGTTAVFECAVQSIFRHPDIIQHNRHVDFRDHIADDAGTESDPVSPETEEIPSLDQVLEERLAKFYANAIKKVLLTPHQKLYHNLHKIDTASIVRSDVLLYSEVDKVEHEFLERSEFFFGMGKLRPQQRRGETADSPKTPDEEILNNIVTTIKPHLSLSKNRLNRILLRVWVDISCHGALFVHFCLLPLNPRF